ncbi:MAG: cold shock domain-containing protein [Candidatus Promineifilaceae bacterium]|nr:cold shock domain-containing protein [Candidatus Promineifilaceae bacterium]
MQNFRDTWAEDEDGNRFVFTVEMKRKLAKADLPIEPESLTELDTVPARPQSGNGQEAPPPAPEGPEVIQIDPETGKYLGALKWYNPSRGYGFISRGGGEDIFFHKTSTLVDPTTLNEGQWLLYDVEERAKGPEATEVEPYSGDLPSS